MALAVIFLAAIIWIYSQLSSSFEEYVEERNFNEIELFAQTNPEDGASDEELSTWLKSVSEMIPGARSAYLEYDFDTFNFVASLGSQPLLDLFNANAATPAFIEATDSCYYLVPMRMNTTYQVDYSLDPDDTVSTVENSILYFIPIVDETGYQASGAIMIAVPEIAATGFESLLKTLLIMLSAAFIIISFIIMFTRDPMTGFLVLALFVIVALFVAFPLFEAVRLSFLVNGHLSFETWKACLSAGSMGFFETGNPDRDEFDSGRFPLCFPHREDKLQAEEADDDVGDHADDFSSVLALSFHHSSFRKQWTYYKAAAAPEYFNLWSWRPCNC